MILFIFKNMYTYNTNSSKLKAGIRKLVHPSVEICSMCETLATALS